MQDLSVAVVQPNIFWENKAKNFDQYTQLLSDTHDADLIVLPEMFQTGFCFNEKLAERLADSETLKWMAELANSKNSVITGSFMVEDDGKVFNRLVWMKPDGEYETYDKRHLFSMSDEPKHFSAGDTRLFIELKGWKICPMICYDLRFPVWIRNTEFYDLVLFVANWPERRSQHWATLLQARAIENQCFVIGANRVGNDGNDIYHDGRSAIINPMGQELESNLHDQVVLSSTLQYEEITKIRRYMPFLKDADRFELL